jgi:hypothetical protein
MAYFNNAFYKTFVVDGAVVTAATATKDLGKGKLGLVVDSDWKTIAAPGGVVPANSLAYLVQGSLYASDTIGNNPGHGGYQESVKSKGINPRYISRVWEQDATVASQATAKICVASDCAPCGSNLFVRMDVKGSPALRFLNHNSYAIGDSSGDASCNGAALPGLCCAVGQTYLDPAMALAGAMQMLLCDPLIKPFTKEDGAGMLVTKAAASPQTDFDGVATLNTITAAGTGYVTATNVATTASGSGTGLTVDIVASSGVISAVTVNNAGNGYAIAEVITISGGGADATIPVLTISADSGSFTFAQILDGSYVASTDPVTNAVTACATTIGAYVDTKFGNCSFDTRDHYNAEPVQLILSVLDETGNPCNDCGVATMTPGSMQQTQGEEVIRALILSERYRQSPYNQGNADSARIREIEMSDDLLDFVTRSAVYKAYYVQHVVPRFNNPSGVFDNDQYVCQIFVKDSDTAGKTAVEAILDALIALANTAGQNIAMETFSL